VERTGRTYLEWGERGPIEKPYVTRGLGIISKWFMSLSPGLSFVGFWIQTIC
jgi:hypothetical protein